ncbi:MAG: hypothetical protein M3Y27_21875 [Acidobacteriota bacterium]|nr:hypothetical protein [Acidobacteriota bacterium]
MLRTSSKLGLLAASALFVLHSRGQDRVQRESIDLSAVYKIKTAELGLADGKPKSKIVDLMNNLTDRLGPRLTNSPNSGGPPSGLFNSSASGELATRTWKNGLRPQAGRCRAGSALSSTSRWSSPLTSN